MSEVVERSLRLVPQPFESTILGFAVERLELQKSESIADIVQALKSSPARLVMCRIEAHDSEVGDRLRALGFNEVEQLVTFERDTEGSVNVPAFIAVGDADAADRCAEIARGAFRYDRFHADGGIAGHLADELKAMWAGNNARGRADRCLLARRNGDIVGFSQCLKGDEVAVIDLIAVAPEAQGHGVGRALVDASFAAYRGRVRTMRAGTQAANFPSLALYRSAGMTAIRTARTFHRWDR
jgi:ribosomal protein S18 acetylase RimI-like enzyme